MAGINKFKEHWIRKGHLESEIKEEIDGAQHYRNLASDAHNNMEEQALRQMADDEQRHAKILEDMETKNETTKHTTNITQEISKPGPSIHSDKWDRCVEEVGKDPSVNAYAICTAQLGEESFKSQLTKSEVEMAKSELKKEITTAYAGPIPKSGLAEQDLEGETKKSVHLADEIKVGDHIGPTGMDIEVVGVRRIQSSGHRVQYEFTCKTETGKTVIKIFDSNDVVLKKGTIEQTGKALEDIKDEAEDADTKKEKHSLIENIKSIQLKRQRAIISEREKETNKSFKEVWNKHE